MDSRLRPFGSLFNKSLRDLIRGIRQRKEPEELEVYLKQVVAEARQEARSPDLDTKAMAILKLAYLVMYGIDMSWASFHVLEVMAAPKFQQKRVGYLAMMHSIKPDPDLLVLSTNLLKTDLASASQPRVAIALSGLATIVTPMLASDVAEDVAKMLNHSLPYVRKKAVLAMYKVILQYPEALSEIVPRLRARLQDDDKPVVSATVSVVCELTHTSTNPKRYVELVPALYEILTTVKSNWCLIKTLKLFAAFVRVEPRLKAKIKPYVLELMQETDALSLVYECLACIVNGGMLEPYDVQVAATIVQKANRLIVEHDPNLRFVGLHLLAKVAQINQEFVADERSTIFDCIDDSDEIIRHKVIEMLPAIVSESSLYDMVVKLMNQMRDDHVSKEYKQMLADCVVSLCQLNNYANLPNFEWYTETLVELAVQGHVQGIATAELVGEQLVSIAVRVKSIRPVVVMACRNLSANQQLVTRCPRILDYAVWVIGEYIGEYVTSSVTALNLLELFFSLPPRPVVVTALVKTFGHWVNSMGYWSEKAAHQVNQVVQDIIDYLTPLSFSADSEMQERAMQFLELFKLSLDAITEHKGNEAPGLLTVAFPSLYNLYDITPIPKNAQIRIAPPADLDLDTPVALVEDDGKLESSDSEPEESELIQVREQTPFIEQRDPRTDPYYLTDEPKHSKSPTPEPKAVPAPSPKHKRIQKVKVEIAPDETIEGDDFVEKAVQPGKPLLQVQSRLKSFELENEPTEVVVKHKKIKKKKSKKHA